MTARFEWLRDHALVAATLTDPALWPWVAYDGLPPEAVQVQPHVAFAGVVDGDDYLGMFAFEPISRRSVKAHMHLLPAARGRGVELARACIEWLKEQDPKLALLVGETPSENRLAMACMRRIGFQEVGRLAGAVTQQGKVQDLVISQFLVRR